MAACRGLDVLLGATAGDPVRAVPAALVVAAHTYTVTALSRREVSGGGSAALPVRDPGRAPPGSPRPRSRPRGSRPATAVLAGGYADQLRPRPGPAARRPGRGHRARRGRRRHHRAARAAGRPHRPRRSRLDRGRRRRRRAAGPAARPEGVADMSAPPHGAPTGCASATAPTGSPTTGSTDALAVIADLGYTGVALTLDHDHLDPFAPELARRVAAHRRPAARPRARRWSSRPAPATCSTRGASTRPRCCTTTASCGSTSCGARSRSAPTWAPRRCRSGPGCARTTSTSAPPGSAWSTAAPRSPRCAAEAGVPLGFEPEPGMLVADIAGWRRLHAELGAPAMFGLTLDIGHCRCLEPLPVRRVRDRRGRRTWSTCRSTTCAAGVHEHLEFGDGRDRLPAGAAGPARRRLPRAGRGRAAPALARRARPSRASRWRSCEQPTRHAMTLHRAPGRSCRCRAATRQRDDPTTCARRSRVPGSRGWTTLWRACAPSRTRPGRSSPGPSARSAASRWPRAAPGRPGGPGGRCCWPSCGDPQTRSTTLYHQGDAAERLAVLRALPLLDGRRRRRCRCCRTRCAPTTPGSSPPRSARTPRTWTSRPGGRASLKCVFMGIPLSAVDRLDDRADAELAAMLGRAGRRTRRGRAATCRPTRSPCSTGSPSRDRTRKEA